jgi:hypothetical protein
VQQLETHDPPLPTAAELQSLFVATAPYPHGTYPPELEMRIERALVACLALMTNTAFEYRERLRIEGRATPADARRLLPLLPGRTVLSEERRRIPHYTVGRANTRKLWLQEGAGPVEDAAALAGLSGVIILLTTIPDFPHDLILRREGHGEAACHSSDNFIEGCGMVFRHAFEYGPHGLEHMEQTLFRNLPLAA